METFEQFIATFCHLKSVLEVRRIHEESSQRTATSFSAPSHEASSSPSLPCLSLSEALYTKADTDYCSHPDFLKGHKSFMFPFSLSHD